MFLKLAAVALAMGAGDVPRGSQEKFGQTGDWTVESLQGGCSASRYFKKDKQTIAIARTRSGQIQFTFIADRWKFPDAERSDYGFRIFTPGGRRDWELLSGSEWSSGGAGFIRIAFDAEGATAPLQDLAASSRLVLTREGRQIGRFDAPDTAGAVMMLFRCVGAQRT